MYLYRWTKNILGIKNHKGNFCSKCFVCGFSGQDPAERALVVLLGVVVKIMLSPTIVWDQGTLIP